MYRSLFLIFVVFAPCILVGQIAGAKSLPQDEVSHMFYALGDAGEGSLAKLQTVLNGLEKVVSGNSETILMLGNSTNWEHRTEITSKSSGFNRGLLKNQWMKLGQTGVKLHYIPGNVDWKYGPEGILAQQEYLRELTGKKNIFLPKNGCPIKKVKINGEVELLILDSQWVLIDWNKFPSMNEGCDIKTKEEFYAEIESEVVKSQGKTLLIAMHHPIASLGKFGNRRSLGLNLQQINNPYYNELRNRLLTISRQWKNVLFVAGHDNGLHFVREKGIPIVVSGSSSKGARVRKGDEDEFSTSSLGFAKIVVYENESVWVAFYSVDNDFSEPVFIEQINESQDAIPNRTYNKHKEFNLASIYNKEDMERSKLNESFFGKHYKKDYTTKIKVKNVLLDTLYGGLRVVRKGGGHQTNTLRLEDVEGRKYTMRSLEKSAIRFLQNFIYKTQYLNPEYEETYLLQILQDFWTTANPYGLLTVADLSDALQILHPDPELYFVPKQKALGNYNEEYGDRLYFIEERLTDGHGTNKNLGYSDKIVSTFELLQKLRNRNKVTIDKPLYIRTRLFDNLLGDWDRHADQWRWTAEKKEDGVTHYRPIPRDRDQVYSDFDGFILSYLTLLTPPLRFMQRYDEDYDHAQWFNDSGDDVDLAVLDDHSLDDWLHEARYIKENLTTEVIDKAFEQFPKEVDAKQKSSIKSALLGRLESIEDNARNVYRYLSKYVVFTGTDGDDTIEINRHKNGSTTIVGKRVDGLEKKTFWNRTYNPNVTKEIWVYGLDGSDSYIVSGEGAGKIKLRFIGGNGMDLYRIENNRGIKVYDYKTKPNSFEGKVATTLSDNYELNTYHFMRHPRILDQYLPIVGFDPDNGVSLGVRYNSVVHSLYRNPFSQRHTLEGIFRTGTSGVSLKYEGEFAHVFRNVNLGVDIRYTSPNHTQNFFGFGSDTPNFEDDLDFDFNRTRIQNIGISTGLIFRGYKGSMVKWAVTYDYFEVEQTNNRFIDSFNSNPEVFDGQHFYGSVVSYSYNNFDSDVYPKRGFGFAIKGGYTTNFAEDRSFAYLIPELRLTSKIDSQGLFVFATKLKGHINFNEEYEFHQAASIGGFDGLRGFREQRFSGKQAYYQTSDLRIGMGRLNNGLLPTSISIFAGFDYGRVWQPGDLENEWHTSQGGGVYVNLAGFVSANLAYFNSSDGGRFTFGLFVPF